MSYSRFNTPGPAEDPAVKRRRELIGRGTLLVVGLLLMFAAWKLWGAAVEYAEQDAKLYEHLNSRSVGFRGRRLSTSPYLYPLAAFLGLAGLAASMMAVMSISQMHRVFHRRPPRTHELDDY
ncbi:MAG TPA: hypothetical protein VGN72_23285 [Tepidisphaeraceae bacterium]|jgi:hypothetical protein|nr:hypothetical protein [Tepidisphaeraceae bacterium]